LRRHTTLFGLQFSHRQVSRIHLFHFKGLTSNGSLQVGYRVAHAAQLLEVVGRVNLLGIGNRFKQAGDVRLAGLFCLRRKSQILDVSLTLASQSRL